MVAALHVTEAPADIPAAIRAAKAGLRTQIGDYRGIFAEVEAAMRREVAEIVALPPKLRFSPSSLHMSCTGSSSAMAYGPGAC